MFAEQLVNSLQTDRQLHSEADILNWINDKNNRTKVNIKKITIDECKPWYYDETRGSVHNDKGTFFLVQGIRKTIDNKVIEQPIIVQNEIGYLGLLVKIIDNVAFFLMQAKIEPGNINKVQISPTIQATRSNFTQKHGGRRPAFLDCFLHAKPENTIVDQIQSEQSSRFLKKRNRNVIVVTGDDIEDDDNFKWLTLKQINRLMHYDNLINMDTRTVLSCIPFAMYPNGIPKLKKENELPSIDSYTEIFNFFNNYKMHRDTSTELIPLLSLSNWRFNQSGEFVCKDAYPFKMIFCDISIEGREVQHWRQPCFEAEGIAVFGLIYKTVNELPLFLVQAKAEIGCFDEIELAPSVQIEYSSEIPKNSVGELFEEYYSKGKGVIIDVLLSEEGGRFYHEQNRNIIINIEDNKLTNLPSGYFWCTYTTLNSFSQVNNILNIQLRNLLSLFLGES